jgi:hypothetical protein
VPKLRYKHQVMQVSEPVRRLKTYFLSRRCVKFSDPVKLREPLNLKRQGGPTEPRENLSALSPRFRAITWLQSPEPLAIRVAADVRSHVSRVAPPKDITSLKRSPSRRRVSDRKGSQFQELLSRFLLNLAPISICLS